METIFRDIRFGIRSLVKRPGSTAIAVLALALGIGVNTAVFSVVDSVLLRPLPFKDPGRLVSVWEGNPGLGVAKNEMAPANFRDLRDQNRVFEGLGAFGDKSFNLSGEGEPDRLEGLLVSANVLEILGVRPALGRTFLTDEDQPGKHRVAVLSHKLWQRRFNQDPSVLGRNIRLDGESFTIVGVMPKGFFFPQREIELWTPWAMDPEEAAGRGDHYLRVVGRLGPGITEQRTAAEVDAIAARLSSLYPRTNEGLGFSVNSLHQDYVGNLRLPILILFAAVGLVLLIACANVANLQLAHGTTRRKEIAIRIALGARRWGIMRQLLMESLLLVGVGGLFGLLGAVWGVELLSKLTPERLSQLQDVSVDVRVLLFTFGVALLTGVVFGSVPALQASKGQPGETLNEVGRDRAGGIRGNNARRVLVIAEVALAVVLLVGAGLLLRSFQLLRRVDPGFPIENLVTMRMVLPGSRYPSPKDRRVFYDAVLQKINDLPGVEAAGMISFLPLSMTGMNFSFSVEGRANPGDMNLPMALYRVVTPDYFRAMSIPILRGRVFDHHDSADSPAVVVVNRQLAEQFWPGEDPTGKRLKIGPIDSSNPWATVVGVVGDVRQSGLYGAQKMELYGTYGQDTRGFAAPRDLIVRTKTGSQQIAGAVRQAVWAVDKDQPISNVRTMEEVFSETVASERFQTVLLTSFAGVALLLTCVGLYGVISYAVVQRTHEIGVRMALGAQQSHVLNLVIKQGMVLTFAGLALGLVGALAVTRVMSDMLYGVKPTDPVTFFGVPPVLVAVAFLACYVPARRATKVDPLVALRYE